MIELITELTYMPVWIQGDFDFDEDTDFNDIPAVNLQLTKAMESLMPNCTICDQKEILLAQIGSEENANLMWGDGGIVYLFCCATHIDNQQLIWQCY